MGDRGRRPALDSVSSALNSHRAPTLAHPATNTIQERPGVAVAPLRTSSSVRCTDFAVHFTNFVLEMLRANVNREQSRFTADCDA